MVKLEGKKSADSAQIRQMLTAEQAEDLLLGDVRNLARKVNSGKTLTIAERNVLTSFLAGGKPTVDRFAKNIVELASVLGVSRKTIQRASKEAGCPAPRPDGRHEIAAWREFLKARGTINDEESPADARIKNILLKNQKLEIELAILRKEYAPTEEVEQWGAELGAALRAVISRLHLIAPNLAGLSIADIESRLIEEEDEILKQIHALGENIKKWSKKDESVA